ncbi:hypothetical protein MRX96_001205 [Rhipicephalus microplus]
MTSRPGESGAGPRAEGRGPALRRAAVRKAERGKEKKKNEGERERLLVLYYIRGRASQGRRGTTLRAHASPTMPSSTALGARVSPITWHRALLRRITSPRSPSPR